MSFQVSQTLYISELKRRNINQINYIINSNNNFLFSNNEKNNIENNYIEPTFDISTDIKFIKSNNYNKNLFNSNLENSDNPKNFYTNENPYKVSKISIDKYNKIKNMNNNIFSNNINDNKLIKSDFNNKKHLSNSFDKKYNYFFDYRNDDNIGIKNKPKTIDDQTNYKNIQNNFENINDNINNLEKNNNNYKKSLNDKIIGENIGLKDDKYLKKENEKLAEINSIYKQIINNLFFFINQLSQKFDPNKKNFNLSYYFIHLNDLSSDLNNLIQNIINTEGTNNMNYSPKKINEIDNCKENQKFNHILNERFSFGKIDNININHLESDNINKKIGNNKDKMVINNINLNKKIHIENDYNQNNNKYIDLNNQKNEKIINSNNNCINVNNKKFNNIIENENDLIKSINNIIYK